MRSTLDIIIAVQESQPVTEEELKLALLSMSSINHFVESELRTLADAVTTGKLGSAQLRASFSLGTLERMFFARKKPPREWLGEKNIPGNPDYESRRKRAKAIYKKATGEEL